MTTPALALTRDLWVRLGPHLDQALALDEAGQAQYLAGLRTGDEQLAAQLESLLEEHRTLAEKGFLERTPDMPLPQAGAGEFVGAYRLLSPIGSGGMGTVWLAERSDGRFERKVAVKFLSFAAIGHGEERFRREGAILARMRHPNIAQLMDAGVTEAGYPFLVIEHIDGEPIDSHCERLGLDLRARLLLFLDVLTAVQHAHANLVVHRDLKPSNVLVTRDGTVKLLDFGIAKLLEEDGGPGMATLLTRESGAGLTPEFAAPEQLTGAPVSTATDIYALGVLLFVLLTGKHPAGGGRSAAALVQAVVLAEAPRASAAVNDSRSRRALRGDLDTIIAKALKKSPEERFPSASAMADDLRRHLRHEPIAARPDSVGYRAAKFARRQWLPVTAAAITVLGLATGLQVANRERAEAQQRFLQVRQLANRVLDLGTALQGIPGAIEARQQIAAMSGEYLEALRLQAASDRELALEVGIAYSRLAHAQGVPTNPNLGQYEQAEQSLRHAAGLLDLVLASAPHDRPALRESAVVAQARMILADAGRRREEALVHADTAAGHLESLLMQKDVGEKEAFTATQLYGNIALFYKNAHRFGDAIQSGRRAVTVAPPTPSALMLVGGAWSVVADSHRLTGELDEALQAIQAARAALDAAHFPSEDLRRTNRFNVLWREGILWGQEGGISLQRPEEAAAVLQEALDLVEERAREEPSDASVRILMVQGARELGRILRDHDPPRALETYERCLARLDEVENNEKARRGEAYLLAGSSYPLRRLDRTAEAGQRIDTAFQRLRALGMVPAEKFEPGQEIDHVLRAQADHFAETGRLPQAVAGYEALLAGMMAFGADPEEDLQYAANFSRTWASLAALLRQAGRPEDAEAIEARRNAMWQHWDRRRPNNAFVLSQL
jgi:hypothetical protein